MVKTKKITSGFMKTLPKRVRYTPTCWEWTGKKDKDGYGRMRRGSSWRNVHRIVFYYIYGPTDLIIRHTCNNPCCVHPLHLVAGTHFDNMQDRKAAGNYFKDERHHTAKLNHDLADQIRQRYLVLKSQRKVAEEFNVSQPTVQDIIHDRRWVRK